MELASICALKLGGTCFELVLLSEVLGNKNGKGTFSWADGSSYQVPAYVVACAGCTFNVAFNVAFSI